MTYGTPCHAIGHFVFWYDHVTYRTPCHASGHLVNRECYGFGRTFFTLIFYLKLLPAGFKVSLGAGSSTSKLTELHADLRNSPSPTLCLNHKNPQERYRGRFYLKVTAGWLMKNLPLMGFKLLSWIGKHVRSLILYLFDHRATQPMGN